MVGRLYASAWSVWRFNIGKQVTYKRGYGCVYGRVYGRVLYDSCNPQTHPQMPHALCDEPLNIIAALCLW